MGSRAKPISLPTPDLSVAIEIDRNASTPMTTQLIAALRMQAAKGHLVAGQRLPSSRHLAETLGVSRTVTQAAYEQLFAEGLIVSVRGAGTYISADIVSRANLPDREKRTTRAAATQPKRDVIDFLPGNTDTRFLDGEAWRRCWRRASRAQWSGRYPDPRGDLALRDALCAYLARSRGFASDPENVIITISSTDALDSLCKATMPPGAAVFMEDPGYVRARDAFASQRLVVHGIAVDENGICVDQLPTKSNTRSIAYVTPSHQYPLGHRMSVGRRQALLAWAERTGAYVIEDDYDSEFRYDALPLPALRSMDAERVVYCGTFSKVLTPEIRLAYMVVPASLHDAMMAQREISPQPALVVQRAIAEFIAGGELEKHIWRMRRVYAEKRNTLIDALQRYKLPIEILGTDAGLHTVLSLPSGGDETALVGALRQRGVLVFPLTRYKVEENRQSGIVLGYSALSPKEITTGVERIADALYALRLTNKPC